MNSVTSPIQIAAQDTHTSPLHKRWRLPLLISGIAIVAFGALYFWLSGGRHMSTDDAYIQASRGSISSNVSGKVTAIYVHDNQIVHRGDSLFQIDDQPYRIAVEAALAKLGSAKLEIDADKASYRHWLAEYSAAKDTLSYQQREYERLKKLRATGFVSQAQFDQGKHAFEEASQRTVSAQHQVDSALALLAGNPDIDPTTHPKVQAAQAELDQAQLNLSDTRIISPSDGIVTKVDEVNVGDHIEAASPVFALIANHDEWIEANFKEDQLTHMRTGQLATVTIDTYPDTAFQARVISISPGTGSQFSVLPPENATGNWVKVVQRIPVRLEFAGALPDVSLHSGLSVTVDVDTGYQRRLFGFGHE